MYLDYFVNRIIQLLFGKFKHFRLISDVSFVRFPYLLSCWCAHHIPVLLCCAVEKINIKNM